MYIKLEKENARRFTFFTSKDRDGNVKENTDKTVFGTLSEGIKVGEMNGVPVYENDNWNARFCGKAYEKALALKDKDRVLVTEMNVRNPYNKVTKRNYPQIMVTDFEVAEATDTNTDGEFVSVDEENLPDFLQD